MQQNIDDFLAYLGPLASLPLFPCQWIENGCCACGDHRCPSPGKHPMTRNGVSAATTDRDRIAAWLERWPNANWGVACGGDARVLVVDIDAAHDGEASWRTLCGANDYPDCPTVRTGGGGRHLYFSLPDGVEARNSVSALAEGIDIRWSGGYVIAPGGRNLQGPYVWDEGDDLTFPLAPDWLIKLIQETSTLEKAHKRALALSDDGKVGRGGRHEWVLRKTEAMRLSGDDEDSVVDYLMSIAPKQCDLSDGRTISEQEIRDAYRGAVRKHGEPLTPAEAAEADEIMGALCLSAAGADERAIAPVAPTTRISTIPQDCYDALRGPLKQLYELCLDAPRPQPELSLGAALATYAAVLGGKVETASGLRTNVYIVGVCDTGGGKDEPRQRCKDALAAAGLVEWIGSDNWASATAINREVQKHKWRLSMVDEFGKLVALVNDQRAGTHVKDIPNVLLKIYSSSAGIYNATAYANTDATIRIDQPHLCIFGTTTHGPLFRSLTRESLEDGLLARCLFVRASDNLPPLNHSFRRPAIPEALALSIGPWTSYNPGDAPLRIHETPAASKWLIKYADKCDEKFRSSKTSEAAIYTRAAAHARKVACIFACACHDPSEPDLPVIDENAALWSIQFVESSCDYLITECRRSLAETGHERDLVNLESHIRAAGSDGVSQADLAASYRRVPTKRRNELLHELIEQKRIRTEPRQTGGRGRPAMHFVATV